MKGYDSAPGFIIKICLQKKDSLLINMSFDASSTVVVGHYLPAGPCVCVAGPRGLWPGSPDDWLLVCFDIQGVFHVSPVIS